MSTESSRGTQTYHYTFWKQVFIVEFVSSCSFSWIQWTFFLSWTGPAVEAGTKRKETAGDWLLGKQEWSLKALSNFSKKSPNYLTALLPKAQLSFTLSKFVLEQIIPFVLPKAFLEIFNLDWLLTKFFLDLDCKHWALPFLISQI